MKITKQTTTKQFREWWNGELDRIQGYNGRYKFAVRFAESLGLKRACGGSIYANYEKYLHCKIDQSVIPAPILYFDSSNGGQIGIPAMPLSLTDCRKILKFIKKALDL